jgi:hypothetical protein
VPAATVLDLSGERPPGPSGLREPLLDGLIGRVAAVRHRRRRALAAAAAVLAVSSIGGGSRQAMDIVNPRVAGLDVHKKVVWVAVRLPGAGPGERTVTRSLGELFACRGDDFLREAVQLIIALPPEDEGVEPVGDGDFGEVLDPLGGGPVEHALR